MSAIRRIQIKGERCSGTSFLEALIRSNIAEVRLSSDFGWKHFFIRNEIVNVDDCLFIVIYRDPFDWLRSIHRTPFHTAPSLRNISFSEFIRKEWHCVWNEDAKIAPDDPRYGQEMMFERDLNTGNRFKNVLKLRTAKLLDFEAIRDKAPHAYYIRYEDLAAAPEKFVQELSDNHELKRAPDFHPVMSYRGQGTETYKPKRYRKISNADQAFIRSNLLLDLERRIGYPLDVPG